ncbi:RidA family protein [Cohnella silvisoli]|uniref:RidA family protein n=1 Tax=Cohnella silvisoli TaxID=2873699 RepID=A0ABV1L1L8_9BACL|nr:RidA family protein [Cohnella silvisoli]MCD9025476.1 RidA family protein [Cohnella silvisoli]
MNLKEYFGKDNSMGLSYSQAIKTNNTIYVAGQGPDNLEAPVDEQIRQTLRNVKKVLKEAGAELEDIVKTNVILNYNFITPGQFEIIYKEFFKYPFPVRTVLSSDIGFNIQIDVVAVID